MEMPYGFHIIQADCKIQQTFCFTIPSPFEEGKTINACVHAYPDENGHAILEFWGEVPGTHKNGIPEARVIIARDSIQDPFCTPNRKAKDLHQELMTAISESAVLRKALQSLLVMHQSALENTAEQQD